jgi:hypothetical protein
MSHYSSSCTTFSAACTNIHIFNAAIITEYHSCPTPLQANATNFTVLNTTARISVWGQRTKDYLLITLISYFNQYLNCKLEVQAATCTNSQRLLLICTVLYTYYCCSCLSNKSILISKQLPLIWRKLHMSLLRCMLRVTGH